MMESASRSFHWRIATAMSLIPWLALSPLSAAQDNDFPSFEVVRTWSVTIPAVAKNRVEPMWPQTYARVQSVWLVDAWIDEKGRVKTASVTRPRITSPNDCGLDPIWWTS